MLYKSLQFKYILSALKGSLRHGLEGSSHFVGYNKLADRIWLCTKQTSKAIGRKCVDRELLGTAVAQDLWIQANLTIRSLFVSPTIVTCLLLS